MEVHVGMLLQPAVVLGLVGVQIVKHQMDLPVCVPGDQFIDEVEKLAPPASSVVTRLDQTRSDIQGREQGGCSVALLAMAEAVESLAVRCFDCTRRAYRTIPHLLTQPGGRSQSAGAISRLGQYGCQGRRRFPGSSCLRLPAESSWLARLNGTLSCLAASIPPASGSQNQSDGLQQKIGAY